jgi:hypothetical protein
LAIKNNFTKLIVEGDSQIIINLLRKILNGANPDRISPSWRLLHGLQIITDSLRPNLAIIPAHVRRKANQVADELANMGINWSESELLCNSALEPDHPILQQCIRKAGTMDAPPDGVLVEYHLAHDGGRLHANGARSHVTGSCHRPPPSCGFNSSNHDGKGVLMHQSLLICIFLWLCSWFPSIVSAGGLKGSPLRCHGRLMLEFPLVPGGSFHPRPSDLCCVHPMPNHKPRPRGRPRRGSPWRPRRPSISPPAPPPTAPPFTSRPSLTSLPLPFRR